jgi:uncharacterized protein YecE (DUF72 family)
MALYIGTSGWNYPSGRGTWNGIFYPPKVERARGFDELAFYAERFNTVEVNSTFYGQPRASVSQSWVKRTPAGFEFAIKMYQKFTHPVMTRDKSPVNTNDIDAFKRGIDPIAAAGRLGAVLAQFPARFKDSAEARDYLEWLLDTFRDYPLTLELRHRSWSDDPHYVIDLLNAHGAAWTQIDEPKFRFSIRQDLTPNVRTFYYLRLHGRNARQWWDHENSEDRYNYFYTEDELKPFAETLKKAKTQVKKLYAYLNNHFAAQSVADATVLRHLLDQPVPAPMPAELVRRYPVLEGKVAILPRERLLE